MVNGCRFLPEEVKNNEQCPGTGRAKFGAWKGALTCVQKHRQGPLYCKHIMI